MLPPLFMPETTRSGLPGKMPFTASVTQSVGVPSTAYILGPASSTLSGLWSVREWLVALFSLSGATTYTIPTLLRAVASLSIPSDLMPSSFETSISFLLFSVIFESTDNM